MRRAAAIAAVAALLVFGAGPASASARMPGGLASAASVRTPVLRDAYGLHVVSQSTLDSRLEAVTVSTSALPKAAGVRILLPADYAQHPRRRYPVLYLLDGTSGHASDWTTLGGAEQTTAGLGLIVVMPDISLNGDGGGWCTDWYNGGAYGQPEWETFHIDQLVPWIDHNLRTIATRNGRAIAGLSQGGFCSMSYAARHPDMFETALAYSGAPDIAYDTEAQLLVTPIINATETFLDGAPINSMFGPRTSEEINWAAHDPTTLANNLRDTNLFMYTGNGFPGPLDSGLPNGEANVIEGGVQQLTILFHDRLGALGIPSTFDDYGNGTHSWPYWARDLKWSIGAIMSDFTNPRPLVNAVTYTTADASYWIYNWQVAMHRAVEEFSTLANATRHGFTLQGSGSATVRTPAFYMPRRRYKITIGSSTVIERAGRYGKLTISVPLGPSDTVQEYPLDGPPLGTTVYKTNVSIARVWR